MASCFLTPSLHYTKEQCNCAYHRFLANGDSKEPVLLYGDHDPAVTAPTAWYNTMKRRQFPNLKNIVRYVPDKIECSVVSHFKLMRRKRLSANQKCGINNYDEGRRELINFLSILNYLNNVPWANKRFTPNDDILKRLTATHLQHIVGEENAKRYRAKYLYLIDQVIDFHGAVHLIWVTNRQQGKTETTAKFLAALMITGKGNGQYVNTYCTSQRKAADLLADSKKYISWFQLDEGAQDLVRALGYAPFRGFHTQPAFYYSVYSIYGYTPLVRAQPKTVQACRGDKAPIVIIDEAGFVDDYWFWFFAYPLMANDIRTFTFITTPPLHGTFFSDYIREIFTDNQKGLYFVDYINHALVCPDCNNKDPPDITCVHRYDNIPIWKSSIGFENQYRTMPESKRAAFIVEILGVLHTADNYYFNEQTIREIFNPNRLQKQNPFSKTNINYIFVSVDPGSHESSSIGVSVHTFAPRKLMVLLGMAQMAIGLNNNAQLITDLLVKVFNSVWVRQIKQSNTGQFRVVPFVERNFSDWVARDILETIRVCCYTHGMEFIDPFTHSDSPFMGHQYVRNGINITHTIKEGIVHMLMKLFIDKNIIVGEQCVTHGKLTPEEYQDTTLPEMLACAATQFINFRKIVKPAKDPSFATKETWKMTGVTSKNKDDFLMAFGSGIYHSDEYATMKGMEYTNRGNPSSRLDYTLNAFKAFYKKA